MNRIYLQGNLGQDAELKHGQGGNAYASVSLATSERQKDGTYKTTWHRIKLLGRLAEQNAPHMKKGQKIFVEGRQSHEPYVDKNGQSKINSEVIAFSLSLIKDHKQEDKSSSEEKSTFQNSFDETDIPF
jgi:single-strand DNA-binding protein